MSDSKKLIPTKRPQTSKNPIMRQTSGIKPGLNKTLPRKSKLPGLNKVQQPHRLSNTQGGQGKSTSTSKQGMDEIEKEIETAPVEIKEMLEQASVEQRALTMIEDTLYLFNNKGEGKGAGIEKYELINKEEFEQMKNDIELYRQKTIDLKTEYHKKKEEYEKVSNELNNHNYKYYNTEKAKTDSITKLYSLELQLKQIIVNNSKLQNEIQKEIQEKNNIFRALNEFKRKYDKNIHPELKEIFMKIKDEQYNPVNGVPKQEKIGYLEDKLESLKKELENKENRIQMLKKKIADSI